MKTALVIMAAGMGSRFGGGIKQLEPVGPNGEIIMDYSIHDAIEAGFNKVVFIIRKDIRDAFHDAIGKRIEGICNELNIEFAYAYQELDDLPKGIEKPAKRSKPWGTGQAVLVCKDIIKEPFVVINADDYYGKEAFVQIHDFLLDYTPEKPDHLAMAGFILKNTLSDNGGVTRGICAVNEEGYLTDVEETKNIEKTSTGARVGDREIDPNVNVSMNFWGLTPEFVNTLKEGFVEFFENIKDPLKDEYLLPIYIGELLRENKLSVKVLEVQDSWFGVTYKEDAPVVKASFKELILLLISSDISSTYLAPSLIS